MRGTMISFVSRGDFRRTDAFLSRMSRGEIFNVLNRYGHEGVVALERETPKDSGETAKAWSYEIKRDRSSWSIIWNNSHTVQGRQIAVLLQYGHGTGTGGYVRGRDFINPALRPIFDKIAADVWKEVTSA